MSLDVIIDPITVTLTVPSLRGGKEGRLDETKLVEIYNFKTFNEVKLFTITRILRRTFVKEIK